MFLTDVEDDYEDIQPGRYYANVWTHNKYHVLYLAWLDTSHNAYFGPTEKEKVVVFQDKATMHVYVRKVGEFRKLYRPTETTVGAASFVPTPPKVQLWIDQWKRGAGPAWWAELRQRFGLIGPEDWQREMEGLCTRVTKWLATTLKL